MTVEKVLKKLQKVRNYDEQVRSYNEEIEMIRATNLGAQKYSAEIRGSDPGNKTEDLNIAIIDRIERIEKRRNDLFQTWCEVSDAIETLTDKYEYFAMRYFYIEGLSWKVVEAKCDASHGTIQRAKNNALKKLAKLWYDLDKNEQNCTK